MSKRIVSMLLATALAAGTILTVAPARAEPKIAVDWMRAITDADTVMKRGADVLDSPRCALAGCQTDLNPTATAPERIRLSHVQNADKSLFRLSPRFRARGA